MEYRCPVCQCDLIFVNASYQCSNNHSFDCAKSGYVNLLKNYSSKDHGDNKLMIQARTSHLEKGYYLPLVNGLLKELSSLKFSSLIDCGCGEGYYTRLMKINNPEIEVYGFDLSKEAILYASKKDKDSHYAISSLFDLPLFDNSVDVITSLFAPIAYIEFNRLLKPAGYMIIVTPGPRHLMQLKESLYSEVYLNEEFKFQEDNYTCIDSTLIHDTIHLTTKDDIQNLFMMTPYYYKTSIHDKEKLATLSNLETEIEFSIQVYQKAF